MSSYKLLNEQKVKDSKAFGYDTFFHNQIQKKMDHSYRIFKKVNRDAKFFPAAREFSCGKKDITVLCSNNYLGMSAHPAVIQLPIMLLTTRCWCRRHKTRIVFSYSPLAMLPMIPPGSLWPSKFLDVR